VLVLRDQRWDEGLQKLEGLRAKRLHRYGHEVNALAAAVRKIKYWRSWTSSKDARVELVVVCAQSYVITAQCV